MWQSIKAFFKTTKDKIKARIRKRINELPPLSELIGRRGVLAKTLLDLGDEFAALEPADLAKIEWVAAAADAAQFAADITENIPGLEKLDQVRDGFMLAWRATNSLDDRADVFWFTRVRPFIDKYVENAKKAGHYEAAPAR